MTPTINHHHLLQGRYEAARLPSDFTPERIVPDFAFNVLNPLGLLYRPVVDEAYLANGGRKPVWPEGKSFAVCLTHDVDTVSRHSIRQSARRLAAHLVDRRPMMAKALGVAGAGLQLARSIKNINGADPLHCYERWLETEAAVGARSTFFFWPGWSSVRKHHASDCPYEMMDRIVFDGQTCTVAEMIREIDSRGWEVGLHPSWYSFDNVDEMKYQKAALETTLGKDVVSVRQHFLHYDIRVTPRVQAKAGFLYDSTLGFNDNIGFRFGTSYPWQLYDLRAEEELPITEVPLIIQEGAMLNPSKGMRLDEETAFHYIIQITETVERVGGILTLLWHPNGVINEPWWHLYCRTLDYLKQKNAWFGGVGNVARQWRVMMQETATEQGKTP
jgi:hypothetical protein